MRLKPFYFVFLIILVALADSKRSRGRSRGSSSGSSSFWTRKSKSSSEPQKTNSNPAKPSAPKEPEFKKQNANVQQSSPVDRPIGWDVNNKKIGQPNSADVQKQHYNPSYASGPGGYPQSGLYSNAGAHPQGGVYSNPGMHSNPGAYPHNPGTYPHNQGYPGYNSYNPQAGGYYPNNMGGYGNHPNNMGGYGNQPNHMGGYGNQPNNMGGYGNNPHMGGYGNYPQMPHQQTGMMGSMFSREKHGYGGYGGYGGFGGYGGYGSGMQKSGGFFGKHAFRNVMGGLFVGYLVSGLVSRPYKVYNYYNMPREQREEITLPANVLTLCNENATNICVPGSTAICTQDNKILCVTTMTSASPCQNNSGELCVNSTIPCLDENDPLCQNKSIVDNTTTVSLPCFTNMTIDTDKMDTTYNVTLPVSENNKFCVTTMAVPDPTLPAQDNVNTNATTDATIEQMGWDPSNITGTDYFYNRYGSGY